ncbi:hypothetical protein QP175_16420 [Sphingomonas aerolata]|uniref:hypothetical protein n=1 Tax=Sphingomonas aerolata TaxID=185951 RepID=UPI002FDFF5A8
MKISQHVPVDPPETIGAGRRWGGEQRVARVRIAQPEVEQFGPSRLDVQQPPMFEQPAQRLGQGVDERDAVADRRLAATRRRGEAGEEGRVGLPRLARQFGV